MSPQHHALTPRNARSHQACAFWFEGKHLSLSLGTSLSVQTVAGSAMAFFFLPAIAEASSLELANWCVVFVVGMAFVFFLVYMFLERHFQHYLTTVQKRKVRSYPAVVCLCGREEEMVPPEQEPADEAANNDYSEQEQAAALQVEGTCRGMARFPAIFWTQNLTVLFTVSIVVVSANFFPFLLQEKYGMSKIEAGQCSSLLYWMVARSAGWETRGRGRGGCAIAGVAGHIPSPDRQSFQVVWHLFADVGTAFSGRALPLVDE